MLMYVLLKWHNVKEYHKKTKNCWLYTAFEEQALDYLALADTLAIKYNSSIST